MDPPHTSCFPFIRQMLMSCWFDLQVSFCGGRKSNMGPGQTPPPVPHKSLGVCPYPVIAHLTASSGLQAHTVDVVPAGRTWMSPPHGCLRTPQRCALQCGVVCSVPSLSAPWGWSGVGNEHRWGTASPETPSI